MNKPLHQIYFYLTEGCNLACRHCWLAPKYDPNAQRYPVLPVDLFEDIIMQAKPLGMSSIKLTGGEPFIHPQILDILDIVHRHDILLRIETNGVRCDEEMANRIAACTSKSYPGSRPAISISLDGADAATHEWIRGVKGSYQAALQAIQHLARAGLKPQVIFSVMRHNQDQVEAVVRLAERCGAASVKFNLIQPTERGLQLHQQNETLTIRELIRLGRWVENDLARRTSLRLHYSQPPAFRSLHDLMKRNNWATCGIQGIIGVLASGQYALCGIGVNVKELTFGDARFVSLQQVWEQNPILQTIHEQTASRLQGVCGRCLMKNRCLGSCIAQNYYRDSNLFAPFWFCESAEQEGLFPQSRLIPACS